MIGSRVVGTTVRHMSSVAHRHLYELRVYNVIPNRLKEFLSLTNERLHLRTAHSKLSGYWTVEFGGLNQVAHLWEYDSYAHRSSARVALAADDNWIKQYISHTLPMWDMQINMTLRLLPGSELHASQKKGGAYLLERHSLRADIHAEAISLMHNESKAVARNSGGDLIATFTTEIGPTTGSVTLFRHSSMDAVTQMVSEIRKIRVAEFWSYVGNSSSLGLLPVPISPLQ